MKHKIYIGCDPYDSLKWWQKSLKKIGFYKNRPKATLVVFKKSFGVSEVIKPPRKGRVMTSISLDLIDYFNKRNQNS